MKNVTFLKIASLFIFLLSAQSSFGQEQLLYSENFTGQLNVGAQGPGSSSSVIDPSTAGVTWTMDVTDCTLSAYYEHFKVINGGGGSNNERLQANDTDGEAIWYSPSINISSYNSVRFSFNAYAEDSNTANHESSDYIKTYYSIDDGSTWTQATTNGDINGNFGALTPSQTGLSGSTLQIKVVMENDFYAGERLSMDNLEVYGTSNPTAAFSASANAVDTTQTITFTNNSTNATSYSWNFGDSTTSSETSPSHQYASPGSYTVILTATGSSGSDTATTSITVNIPSETIAIQDFDGATPDWSYTQTFSPTSPVNLFFEDLTGESDGDTTGSASGINWALSGGGGGGELYVHDGTHVHMSKNDGTIAVWQTTDNIDITSTANLNFTVKVRKTKNLDSDDYVRLLYSKNGGALIEIATYYDDINDDTIIGGDINSLTGNTLIGNPGDTIKLFMHVRNDSNSEQFEWEEIKLTGNVIDGTINSLGTNTTNAWGNKGYLDEAEITFNTVDLSNHDNLNFSFDYFIDSQTEFSGGAAGDNFVYDIYYNGSVTASLTEELIVNGSATDTWTSKSVSVPDGTTSIKVIFNYDVTYAFDEHLGLDNVKVTGIIKLPGCATSLSPTNTATNVSVTPTVSWVAVSGATGYKVYYGTDSNTSTAVAETANTSVTLPTLQNGTQYYWKVVPTNARGDATGCPDAISFTTIQNPAGSVFITGNTVTISKNAYLYLEKDFTNTGGSLTLNSSSTEFASIIVEGTASGNITYNRFVNYQAAGEWDIIGPPVLNQNMQSFAQTNTNNNTTSGAMAMGGDYYALGQYLTQWGSWVNYTTSTIPNANFPAAKGYQMGTNSIGSGSDIQGQTLAFTGEIATTTQTINIQNQNGANGGNGRRWNLVANPFSSYINGNTNAGTTNGGTNFIDVNANVLDLEYTGLYYWDADEDGWDVFNQLQTNSNDGTLFIAPGQGFFVAARNSEVAQISFTPQMRTILGGDDFISGAPILLNYKLDLKLFNGSAERSKTKFHFQ